MNKTLFEKVKTKCKDTGLSEKYLKAITEKVGGSIEDDSTDDTAIEEMANQVAEIAKETQGEATRWAATKKKEPKPGEGKKEKDDDSDDDTDPGKGKGKTKTDDDDPTNVRIKAMEDEIAALKAERSKGERDATIKAAQAKHKIPEWRMKGLVVLDDQDPDEYLAGIKQDLITQNLVPADAEGVKTVTEKAVDQAADSLLESITVK